MFFEDKSAIPAELRCTLCTQPWWGETAVSCPHCDEIFCRPCIEDRLAKANTCPKCSGEVDVRALTRPLRQLKSMSARLPVLCPNRPGGCWRGAWSDLEAHLKECPYDPERIVYVGEPDHDLQCEICLAVLRKPECCSMCEQLFCSACVRQSLQREERCPHCCERLTEDLLKEAPRQVTAMLSRLTVACITKCGWTGEKATYDAHLAACPLRTLAAPATAVAPAAAATTTAPAAAAAPAATAPAAAGAAATATPAATKEVTLTALNYVPQIQASDKVTKFTTMAHIAAPKVDRDPNAKRKSLHVSAVMDISGSMGGEKIKLAKEALKFVADELDEHDLFGLVAFDDHVEERCPAMSMTKSGKKTATTAISCLEARGSTNLSGGLFAGIAQARDLPFVSPTGSFDGRREQRATKPARGPSTSFFGRMSSALWGSSTSAHVDPSAATAAPAAAGFAAAKAPIVDSVPAFAVAVKYNASPMKQDGKWLARYTFELVSALPRGVSHVTVAHGTEGKITLRGASTFGLIPDQKAAFEVAVHYDASLAAAPATFPLSVEAEDGFGQASFDVPAYEVPRPKSPASADTRSRVVMLFTDGQANAGITDSASLVAKTREILAAMPGKDVTIFCFGFGEGHNASLLQQLSEVSQGTYYFVRETKQLKEIFADCIGGLLSIAATGIELTVRPALGVRVSRVMTNFPQRPTSDGKGIVVSIKDLYAEEERDVLVEVEVAPRAVGGTAPVVSFELACENVLTRVAQAIKAIAAVPTLAEVFAGSPNISVDQQLSRFLATEAMTIAQNLADRGDVAAAQNCLRVATEEVAKRVSFQSAYTQSITADLQNAVNMTSSASKWQSEGQKHVSRMKSSHAYQRANNVEECDDASPAMYCTSAKMASRAKSKK